MVALLIQAIFQVMWAVLYRSGPSSSCLFNSFIRRYHLIISRSCIDECEFCNQKEVIVTDQCCSLYFRCYEIQSNNFRKMNLNTFKMLQFILLGRCMDWPNDIFEVLIFVVKQDCSSSKAWKMIALHFLIAVKGVLVSVLSSLNCSQQSVLNSSKYISIRCVLLTADGNFVLLFFSGSFKYILL